jgi:RHS repeat-associated protein
MGDDYEVTGGVVTKYVSAAGLGVVAKRTGGATFWLHRDRLGSVQAITDAAGQLVQRRTYRPYGETIADSTGHVESRGWIEQRNDAETGLTYLHARYYDPTLGLFLSPDPIAAALNTYGYASSDPLNASDRSGLLEYRDDTETRFHDEGPRAGLGVFVGNPFATPVGVGRMDELLQRDLNNFETASTTTWTYADGSSKTEDYYGGAVTTTERNSAGDVTSSTTTTTTTETWGGCSGSSSVQCSTNVTVADKALGYFLEAQIVPVRLIDSLFPEHDRDNWFDRALDSVSSKEQVVLGVMGVLAGKSNKMHHIFGKAKHNLRPLVAKLGSEDAVFSAVEAATQAEVARGALSGVFQTTVSVGGYNVVVRGRVMNGVPQIGTFFVIP